MHVGETLTGNIQLTIVALLPVSFVNNFPSTLFFFEKVVFHMFFFILFFTKRIWRIRLLTFFNFQFQFFTAMGMLDDAKLVVIVFIFHTY